MKYGLGAFTVFTPENELEQAMLRAASDRTATNNFYRLLLESELIVLGSFGQNLVIDTLRTATGSYHPIFTSPVRRDAFAADAAHFRMLGRTLFESTRGAKFLLNPRSRLAKTLTPDEINWFLNSFQNIDIAIVEPSTYPTRLIKALCVLCTSRSQVITARLAHMTMQEQNSDIHLVIGIEADGDISRLAQEIIEASATAKPGAIVDVVHIPSGDEFFHPLQKYLLTIQPFFRRPQVQSA